MYWVALAIWAAVPVERVCQTKIVISTFFFIGRIFEYYIIVMD
jgi:hypothetical protein